MRASVAGLGTPYPLGGLMPAVYQDDEFTMRLTAALDEVLAPVVATLDCITAYIDPLLAPEDFLQWLSGWFGAVLDENWPAERQRGVVSAAAGLYRIRGTLPGLRAHLELVTGGQVEAADSGGVAWSVTPDGQLPGEDTPGLSIRITVADAAGVNIRALDELISAVKPAHVIHRLEVTER